MRMYFSFIRMSVIPSCKHTFSVSPAYSFILILDRLIFCSYIIRIMLKLFIAECNVIYFDYFGTPAHLFFPFKDFIYSFIFRERGREGEREGEKHQWVRETLIGCLLHDPRWGPGPQPWHVSLPGTEPSNWEPFVSQASAQSTEPHKPGQLLLF